MLWIKLTMQNDNEKYYSQLVSAMPEIGRKSRENHEFGGVISAKPHPKPYESPYKRLANVWRGFGRNYQITPARIDVPHAKMAPRS